MNDRPGIVNKLPSRPLSVAEGQALADQESERSWVRPESIIVHLDGPVVVALLAINREAGHAWLLGYSPDEGGWTIVDEFDQDKIEHDAFYEQLDEWEADTFAGREEWVVG